MNREELNKFLGKKVKITIYGIDVTGILNQATGILNQASDECFEKFSIVGDIWYLLIEETTHQPICLFRSNHVTKCTLVPELETDSKSEK